MKEISMYILMNLYDKGVINKEAVRSALHIKEVVNHNESYLPDNEFNRTDWDMLQMYDKQIIDINELRKYFEIKKEEEMVLENEQHSI